MATETNLNLFEILNIEECRQIVKNALKLPTNSEFKIIKHNITPGSSELVGFMGEYFKLNISIEDNSAPKKCERNLGFFIKSLPISNEFHRAECLQKGFFVKEISIYNDILPNVQKYASSKLYPVCYFSRQDLFVLEDLSSSAAGFRHLAVGEIYSLQHHHVMLRHLAKLHAGSLAWELNENFNIGECFKNVLFEMQLTLQNEWFITGAKSIIYLAEMHPKYQTTTIKAFISEKLLKIICDTEPLTAPSKEFRNVLCHRDSWDRNIFYSFNEAGEPVDCRLVDFQLTRYNPPGLDVLFFLHMTTRREERESIYNHCLNFYHEALKTALGEQQLSMDLITKEDFLLGCKHVRLAVLILHAICEPLVKMPKGLANKWRAEEQELFDYYMNSNRDELLQRVMAVDKNYKNVILEPIEELMDYLLDLEGVENFSFDRKKMQGLNNQYC